MEYRNLGKSGLQLSELSLGSWLTFGKQIENSIAKDLMQIAYDHGVNFFDNAEIYANGESEIVNAILHEKVVSFLVENAKVEEVDPKPPEEDDHSHSHSHG